MKAAWRDRALIVLLAGAMAWPCTALAQPSGDDEPAAKAPAKGKSKGKQGAEAGGKKLDAAGAQQEVEAGVTSLNAGRVDAAIASLTGALSAGSLPPNQTARALYYRGMAYRRQSKPALAIADLTSALWLRGALNDQQRADALQQRAAAYREAGLPDQSEADTVRAASALKGGGATRTSSVQTSATTPAAATPAAAPAPSSGGIGGIFASMFGGGASASAPATAPPAAPAPAPTPQRVAAATPAVPATSPLARAAEPAGMPRPHLQATDGSELPEGFQGFPEQIRPPWAGRQPTAAPPAAAPSAPAAATPVVTRSWDASTQVKPAPGAVRAAAPAPAPPPVAAPEAPPARKAGRGEKTAAAAPSGAFRVQVAAVRSAQEAEGVAARLQERFGRELGGRAPVVDQTVIGNMGTIYRVQVGPFASEPRALCERLRSEGLDCRIVAQ